MGVWVVWFVEVEIVGDGRAWGRLAESAVVWPDAIWMHREWRVPDAESEGTPCEDVEMLEMLWRVRRDVQVYRCER